VEGGNPGVVLVTGEEESLDNRIAITDRGPIEELEEEKKKEFFFPNWWGWGSTGKEKISSKGGKESLLS